MFAMVWYSGKTGHYKLPLKIFSIPSSLVFILMLVFLKLKNPSVYGMGTLILKVCATGSYTINLELLAEVSFPVGTSLNILA